MFSVKDTIVNGLGLAGHMASVTLLKSAVTPIKQP